MVRWRVDEFTLTTFHLRSSFYRDLLDNMTPWVRLTTDVRRAIYLNSLDKTRKDQWFWMQQYELMLVERLGERARFLPQHKEKPDVRTEAARAPARTPDHPAPQRPRDADGPPASPAYVDFGE